MPTELAASGQQPLALGAHAHRGPASPGRPGAERTAEPGGPGGLRTAERHGGHGAEAHGERGHQPELVRAPQGHHAARYESVGREMWHRHLIARYGIYIIIYISI